MCCCFRLECVKSNNNMSDGRWLYCVASWDVTKALRANMSLFLMTGSLLAMAKVFLFSLRVGVCVCVFGYHCCRDRRESISFFSSCFRRNGIFSIWNACCLFCRSGDGIEQHVDSVQPPPPPPTTTQETHSKPTQVVRIHTLRVYILDNGNSLRSVGCFTNSIPR